MACEFICDACGKREPGIATMVGWTKPVNWYTKHAGGKALTACSTECIKTLEAAAKTESRP